MKLRDLREEDIPFMLEWMHDAQINCYYRFDPGKMTEESVKKFIKDSYNKRKNIHLAITNECDEYYGTVSLKNIDYRLKRAEYAISLRQVAKHKGFGSYATKEILKIAFRELKLDSVYLNVYADNLYAIHFYEKYGFRYIDNHDESILINGRERGLKWFIIDKMSAKIKEYNA